MEETSMTVLRNRTPVGILFSFLLCFLFACVQTGPKEGTSAEMETWDLRITGEAKGTRMAIWRENGMQRE